MKPLPHLLAAIAAIPLLTGAAAVQAQTTATVTILHSFTNNNGDGANPRTGVIQGTDGNFYGTTQTSAGVNNGGTIFKITPAGAYSILHNFTATGTDGSIATGGLLQGTDGNFYGTTEQGGAGGGNGIAYRISPSGSLITLYNFTGGGDGATPTGSLVQGNDGNFYGPAYNGGSGYGLIFRLTPAGSLTAVHTFSNSDGAHPLGTLLLNSDGNFYGTTENGGSDNNHGVIFKLTPTGTYTVLHNFTRTSDDGAYPAARLIRARDGSLYGTAQNGGLDDDGLVYKMTSDGTVTALHSFTRSGADGAYPFGGVVQATDGNFYGATPNGGSGNDRGVFYQLTPTGTYSTLHNFTGNGDGQDSLADVIQGKDGNFYGTTFLGGSNGEGTVFRVNVVPSITSATTAAAKVGTAFSYQITALNSPASFGATGLPSGLSVSASTGTISGKPTVAGTFAVTLKATNVFGTASAQLTITVKGPPIITSAKTATATTGTAFSYQITANGSPTSFGASGLPSGLSVSSTTGKISGTPTKAGTYSVTIAAFNADGSGSATLTLTVKQAPPVITSNLNPPSRQGVSFGYQITATNSPTSYAAVGLPPGLGLSKTTGKVSGTPTQYGVYTVKVSATNSGGTGTATVTIVVKQAVPVITSDLNPPSRQGVSFGYQITATNNPTSYVTAGLPPGLGLSKTTGKVSGTPTKAGTYKVQVSATNSGGTGTATVTIVVKGPIPAITSATSATATNGVAFSFQITATGNPNSFGESGHLPAGITLNTTTGKISGTTTQTGTFPLTLVAFNSSGSGKANFTLVVK